MNENPYGFDWGNVTVSRYAEMPNGTRVVGIEVNGKRALTVYVSPAGRSVRVFRTGKGEMRDWEPGAAAQPADDAGTPTGNNGNRRTK